jgi:lipopolysaccharide/colanic/teichoic acid biosynthesis glycosyltransferase
VDICERAAALALLTAASPVLLVSMGTVAALSRRSPLIAHRRVGWQGESFWMLKLRTMWDNGGSPANGLVERIEDIAGPQRKSAADPRVTSRFARFCRRHSIDELPQLWHVVRGEMALIGPRPLTAAEIRQFYGSDGEEVLQVKPGIAGLWQVSGRSRLTYPERLDFDLQFVRRRTPGMYLKIFVGALAEVISGTNAW